MGSMIKRTFEEWYKAIHKRNAKQNKVRAANRERSRAYTRKRYHLNKHKIHTAKILLEPRDETPTEFMVNYDIELQEVIDELGHLM